MDNSNDIKKWLLAWENAGKFLDSRRVEELAQPDYYTKRSHAINAMLKYAIDHAEVRLSSGFVVQQKIFKQLNDIQLRAKHAPA